MKNQKIFSKSISCFYNVIFVVLVSFITLNNAFAQTISSIGNFKIKGAKVGSTSEMVSYAQLNKKEFVITQEKFDEHKKATMLIINTINVKNIKRIGNSKAPSEELYWVSIETMTENDINVKKQTLTDKAFKNEVLGFVEVYFDNAKDMGKFIEEVKKYYKK